jgi:hypothetical protein
LVETVCFSGPFPLKIHTHPTYLALFIDLG